MALASEEVLLKERIKFLLSVKKTNISKIAENDNERIMLGRQINGDNTVVSFRTLYKILYMYPDVDANWLILGEGSWKKTVDHPRIYNQQRYEMQTGENNKGTINFTDALIPYPVQALLDEKDKRIAELEKTNATLQNILNAFANGSKKA